LVAREATRIARCVVTPNKWLSLACVRECICFQGCVWNHCVDNGGLCCFGNNAREPTTVFPGRRCACAACAPLEGTVSVFPCGVRALRVLPWRGRSLSSPGGEGGGGGVRVLRVLPWMGACVVWRVTHVHHGWAREQRPPSSSISTPIRPCP
jgi:hypothetical protein